MAYVLPVCIHIPDSRTQVFTHTFTCTNMLAVPTRQLLQLYIYIYIYIYINPANKSTHTTGDSMVQRNMLARSCGSGEALKKKAICKRVTMLRNTNTGLA